MSKLKVSAIHDPDNDNEAITVDTSGNVTFSQNATFSGTVSGIDTGAKTISDDDTATYNDGDYFYSPTGVVYRKLNDGTSSAWYSLADGTKQTNEALSVETSFAAGYSHSAYINSDGELYVAGNNASGELGLGDTTDRTSWTKVDIDNVEKVFITYASTFVIKTDGTVWATGYNYGGNLGLGDTTYRNEFTQVNITNVSKISGGEHTIILKTDGSLWTCGYNGMGALGNGTTTNTSTFAQIVSSGVVDIWGSMYSSYYIDSSGAVYSCGWNHIGQLGIGNTTDRSSFGTTGITSGASKFPSGFSYYDTAVLKSDGSLWGCGANTKGQLNNGNTTNQSSFIQSYSSGVEQVTVGNQSYSILKTDGSVYSIGDNAVGQLGNGNTTDQSSYYENFASGSNVAYILRGASYFLIIEDDNTISGLGLNSDGQLALGDTTDRTSFVDTGITDAVSEDQSAGNKTIAELA